MVENPITIGPGETIKNANRIMRENRIGCLPVVNQGELIGVITESDFLKLSNRLIESITA